MGPRRKRSALPGMLIWIVVALAVIGGAYWLSSRDSSKPVKTIEKIVPDNALGR